MTLQQLEYVLAVDQYRHFAKAAEACGVTQSTLSTLIHKLEEELDVVIFDRSAHPLRPTSVGEGVIEQARVTLYHARQLKETAKTEGQKVSGLVRIGLTPTIAPYVVPQLIGIMNANKDVEMHAIEVHRDKIIKRLLNGELDVGVMSLSHRVDGLLEIPLYREKLVLYVSTKDPLYQQEKVSVKEMSCERLWTLHNEISFVDQVCDEAVCSKGRANRYSSGCISTLLHVVNHSDGYTVIPELHVPMLRKEDLHRVRPLEDPVVARQVSLFVREDYVREGLLNVVANAIKQIIPAEMLDSHIAKYPIRLR